MLPRKKLFRLILRFLVLGAVVVILAPFYWPVFRFAPFANEPRVRCEAGAENAAKIIAQALPDAIATIERAHLQPFAKPVEIFVCATTASFDRHGYAITGAGGYVFNGRLFISPKRENTPERLPRLLAHELSHLHLEQWRGMLRTASGVPGWFKEGLAVYASGAGAETVSEADARNAIVAGAIFKPDATGSLLFPQTGARDGLKVHLFYRESAMFVAYLAHRDSAAFKRVILQVEQGEPFADTIRLAYGLDVVGLQHEFVAEIKKAP
jgi:hypothetical protein